MPRSVTEWIGKTDDTPPSAACKRRILVRQGYKCAINGQPFTDKDKPEFDHIVELWLGGQNRESNLQAVHIDPHARKTAAAAAVRAKSNRLIDRRFDIRTAPSKPIQSAPQPRSAKAHKHDKHAREQLAMPARQSLFGPATRPQENFG